jgi:DNA-directed RNA polymerase specialized sigma24 family protein
MARHVCREWRRARRRDRHRFTESVPESEHKLPSDTSDAIQQLRLSIAKLPEKERLALHLMYLQEDSAEIARGILGLSHSGFYKIVARARERLAKMLSSEKEIVP